MISCNQHDYIEIVCMFRYPLRLTLKSGQLIEGIAVDVALNEDRLECLEMDINGQQHAIILDQISQLEVAVANPHFDKVCFD